MNRYGALFALALSAAVLLPSAPAAEDPNEVVVDYSYVGSGVADGAFLGHCSGLGVKFPEGAVSALPLESSGGVMTIRETRVNYTTLSDGTQTSRAQVGDAQQWVASSVSIPPGTVNITWDEGGLASLFPSGYPLNPKTPLPIQVSSPRLEWSAASSDLPSGASFWFPVGGTVRSVEGGYPGWKREMVAPAATFEIVGDATLYLRQATVTQGGRVLYEMAPYATEEFSATTPTHTVTLQTVRFAEAFLELSNSRILLSSSGARPVCSGLEGRLDGAVTFQAASGTYTAGGKSGVFGSRALTLVGSFAFAESPGAASSWPDSRARMEGTGHGAIHVVGIDFEPALVSGPSQALVERVAFWSLVAAGFLAVARVGLELGVVLYTRLCGDEILGHPRRALIVGRLRANPGCTLADLVRDTGISRGVLKHHLRFLKRAGHVRRIEIGGLNLLVPFAKGMPPPARLLAQRDPRLLYMLETVESGPVRQADLVRGLQQRFNVGDRTARKWVAKAARVGLLAASGPRNQGVCSCAC